MAHVGKVYPFFFHRDLSITIAPMLRLAKRYRISANNWTSNVALVTDPDWQFSGEGVVNWADYNIIWRWNSGTAGGDPYHLIFKYQIVHDARECETWYGLEWRGITDWLGPVNGPLFSGETIDRLNTGTLLVGSGSDFLLNNGGTFRAMRWAEY